MARGRRSRATGPAGHRWLAALLLGLSAMVAVASACGGSSESSGGQFSRVIPLGEGDTFPEIANRTLAVGENRFVLLLLDQENSPVLGAQVHLAFFDLNGDEPRPGPETDARTIQIARSFTHTHVDDTVESHHAGETAFYIAQVDFDAAGRWGVEITGTLNGSELDSIPFQFDVLDKSPEPAIGDPAPPTRQLTLADAGIAEIDSAVTPRRHMHDTTVADAIAEDKPVVVTFASPAFCVTRICGPVMDTVIDPLHEKYGGEATFIHIEPYKLKELREGIDRMFVKAMEEWSLRTEPWVFVIDRQGKIAGKFEGIVALDEVEGVLRQLLGEG
ncbi:MAG: TlpA family protein disulfide reductase [Dehalococcoidia bacterium]